MKSIATALFVLGIGLAHAAYAEPTKQNAMMLAQAHDRCMTTYAVRESKTTATDAEIFSLANAGCKDLEEQLYTAIKKEYPSSQSEELIPMLQSQAESNFTKLLLKIRNDRSRRAGN